MKNFNNKCSKCGDPMETDRHILFDCQEEGNMSFLITQKWDLQKLQRLVAALTDSMDKQQTEFAAILTWLIWKSRM